jgi:hypothetical protein
MENEKIEKEENLSSKHNSPCQFYIINFQLTKNRANNFQ